MTDAPVQMESSPGYPQDALPVGTVLGQYTIVSVLGRGSFGITYLAQEAHLDQFVAIKEYLPQSYAFRSEDSTVHSLPGDKMEVFRYGRERFLDEARTLRLFKHPNIVRVLTYFEQFNTAYFVMEFEVGSNLKFYLQEHPHQTEQQLIELFGPVASGLAEIHRHGYIHRDVKPQNIYIREDGSPVLLDFGTARDVVNVRSEEFTRILTEGYAPYEQDNPEWAKQGAWTDIYALGATLYYAIVGKMPIDSQTRAFSCLTNQPDPYIPLSTAGVEGFSLSFLKAVDLALAFLPDQRPQSVTEWWNILSAGQDEGATRVRPQQDHQADTLVRINSTVAQHEALLQKQLPESKKGNWPWAVSGLLIVILVSLGFYWIQQPDEAPEKPGGENIIGKQDASDQDKAEEKVELASKDIPLDLTGSAFILAKTSAWHASRAERIEQLIEQISNLPATSDRTRFLVDQKVKLDEARRGASANLKRYSEAIGKLKQYDPELVATAIRDFLGKPEYANDVTYQVLGDAIEEHLSSISLEAGQVQSDLLRATDDR